MKLIHLAILCVLCAGTIAAQSVLLKLVDTEHQFAKHAAEKGTKTAFFANLADDGLVFNPDKSNGKKYWSARPESKALLAWAPNYADVSADGALGYTTGNWEYRPKGKDDEPFAFGQFITIWKRKADGTYKFVADMGVSHDRPAKYSTEWVTSKSRPDANKRTLAADSFIQRFMERASQKGASAAYSSFAAADIRLYRDDKFSFLGKTAALSQTESENGELKFEDGGVLYSAATLAYFVKGYTLKKADNSEGRGNALQVWKFQGGKWKIVLDVRLAVPAK